MNNLTICMNNQTICMNSRKREMIDQIWSGGFQSRCNVVHIHNLAKQAAAQNAPYCCLIWTLRFSFLSKDSTQCTWNWEMDPCHTIFSWWDIFSFIKSLLATQIILVLSEICPPQKSGVSCKNSQTVCTTCMRKGKRWIISGALRPRKGGVSKRAECRQNMQKTGMELIFKCLQGERIAARSCVRQRGCDNCNISRVLQTVWRNTLQNMTCPVLQKLWRRSINSFGTTWSNNWTHCKGNLTHPLSSSSWSPLSLSQCVKSYPVINLVVPILKSFSLLSLQSRNLQLVQHIQPFLCPSLPNTSRKCCTRLEVEIFCQVIVWRRRIVRKVS